MSETQAKAVDVVEDDVDKESTTAAAAENVEESESKAVESDSTVSPPPTKSRKLAEKTWWLPWLLGVAALFVAVLVLTGAFDGEPEPEEQIRDRQAVLPKSTHTVVYEVNGVGKSPEIRYVVDGTAQTEKVEGVDLPWRKEVQITVGPGIGIAQLLAANADADSISCSVSVDGQVVNQGVAPGQYSNVACSAVIRPNPK
ncbi:membrane protein [Actinokineospora alba]|uniref:Membrane protein n=1 Tax=Actinokineospora alba TaxID=504798 RepID=A0A1H0VHN1_9PSEU|nr:MmpS family transport accessory protein [Actinokineospora alba]TDP67710.1 MmpS family membrane protein [Actinokineospora alba]SDJ27755.1 membrane protein [Actinokineospora alba]SDP78062.1 membrane protein [Actinokineospora alba]